MKYRKIGIDFGTSTSIICYQDYEVQEDGKKVPIGNLEMLSHYGTSSIPTAIIEKNEALGIYEDYFGQQALTMAQNPAAKLCTNFKMGLFNSVDKDTLEESKRLTEKYFKFLHSIYEQFSKLTPELESEYKIVTMVSFPVKSIYTEQDYITEAAKLAGFVNIDRMNEAHAAAIFSLGRSGAKARDYIKNYTKLDKIRLLLLDMGAGTTDIGLYEYKYSEDAFELEELSSWPEPGKEKTLGGKEIDEHLLKYCKDSQLLDDYYLSTEQYDPVLLADCKSWKEFVISPSLLKGESVPSFGPLMSRSFSSKNRYGDYKVTKEKLENFLQGYLADFINAVKDVIKRGKVKEEDIDFVIVVGGHSQWYFVKDLLLSNKLKSEVVLPNLNLKKIKLQQDRYITTADPQQIVAMGLALEAEKFTFRPISKHDIYIKFVFTTKTVSMFKSAKSDGAKQSFEVGLLKKNVPLPTPNNKAIKTLNFLLHTSQNLQYEVQVYTRENGVVKSLKNVFDCCPRRVGTFIKNIVDDSNDNVSLDVTMEYNFTESENLNLEVTFFSTTHWASNLQLKIR